MKKRGFLALFTLIPLILACSILSRKTYAVPTMCNDVENIDDTQPIELNRDYERRDQIIGISVECGQTDIGGIVFFEKLPLSTVAQLYEEKFLDPSDQQNLSPTAGDLLAFMCKYPYALASGYVVSPERDDYRVTIDGIQIPLSNVNFNVTNDLLKLCQDADEIDPSDGLFCWWD